jgi:spermidine/putrescine transport system permease protein
MVRIGRWISEHVVMTVGLLVLAYMFLPILLVVLMSFNQPAETRVVYAFDSFTLTTG